MCSPGGVQGLLSCVLQLGRGRASPLSLLTSEPGLSPDAGGKGQKGGGESFSHLCLSTADEEGAGTALLLSHPQACGTLTPERF